MKAFRFVWRLGRAMGTVVCCTAGCAAHVTLPPAPATTAPLADRQTYYDAYRATKMEVASPTTPQIVRRLPELELNNGGRVTAAEDLLDVVDPASHTAQAARQAMALETAGWWVSGTSTAIAFAALGGFLAFHSNALTLASTDPELARARAFGGAACYATSLLAAAVGRVGSSLVIDAARERETAFATWNVALRQRLALPDDDDDGLSAGSGVNEDAARTFAAQRPRVVRVAQQGLPIAYVIDRDGARIDDLRVLAERTAATSTTALAARRAQDAKLAATAWGVTGIGMLAVGVIPAMALLALDTHAPLDEPTLTTGLVAGVAGGALMLASIAPLLLNQAAMQDAARETNTALTSYEADLRAHLQLDELQYPSRAATARADGTLLFDVPARDATTYDEPVPSATATPAPAAVQP